jgi:hypothetical protein
MLKLTRRQALVAGAYSSVLLTSIGELTRIASAMEPAELAGTDPELHFLRRTSFGPTVSELKRIRQIGINAYLEEQLNMSDFSVQTLATLYYPRIALDVITTTLTAVAGFFNNLHFTDLQQAMLFRATMSKAQLPEMMVDFWNDHFNTHLYKAPVPYKIDADRTAIRPNALGNFKTLLRAVCFSPEMQFYLDNCQNVKGDPNENYARELMELHTLGAGGGYTEDDVKALTKLLSGVDLKDNLLNLYDIVGYGGVRFNPAQHDDSAVVFLGHHIAQGNTVERVNQALQILADHPSTARFIATKLARRFISDDPPVSIVNKVAATFTSSSGDIKSCLRTLLLSPEFQASKGQKFKRPTDAIVAAMRAAGLNAFDAFINYSPAIALPNQAWIGTQEAGHEPFNWVAPDGYPDTRAYWDNTSSMLGLQKFFVKMSENIAFGRLLLNPLTLGNGLTVALGLASAKTPRQAANNIAQNILQTPLPPAAMDVLVNLAADGGNPNANVNPQALQSRAAGVMLAVLSSPWFLVR